MQYAAALCRQNLSELEPFAGRERKLRKWSKEREQNCKGKELLTDTEEDCVDGHIEDVEEAVSHDESYDRQELYNKKRNMSTLLYNIEQMSASTDPDMVLVGTRQLVENQSANIWLMNSPLSGKVLVFGLGLGLGRGIIVRLGVKLGV